MHEHWCLQVGIQFEFKVMPAQVTDTTPHNQSCRSSFMPGPSHAVQVADFGLSVRMKADQTHVSNQRFGTPLYIAPEVILDAKKSKAADVFSFGMMLWELVRRRPLLLESLGTRFLGLPRAISIWPAPSPSVTNSPTSTHSPFTSSH